MTSKAGSPTPDPEAFSDAVLAAGRVLMRESVQCLDALEPDLSLSEFRVLVILSAQGPQRLIDIAAALGVTPTTTTRLADRLAGRGLVDRVRQSADRREVHLSVAPAGRALVAAVHEHRRRFVASVLAGFSGRDQQATFGLLARLAGSASPGERESA